MRYRQLGRTGVKVSELCLGTMTFGEQNSEAEGHRQMDYAVDCGINIFDAAEIYPVPPKAETQGHTESIICTRAPEQTRQGSHCHQDRWPRHRRLAPQGPLAATAKPDADQ
jgi:aryl-alcohol dehydrogenase-like predicted oxidoreductase